MISPLTFRVILEPCVPLSVLLQCISLRFFARKQVYRIYTNGTCCTLPVTHAWFMHFMRLSLLHLYVDMASNSNQSDDSYHVDVMLLGISLCSDLLANYSIESTYTTLYIRTITLLYVVVLQETLASGKHALFTVSAKARSPNQL